MSDARPRDPGDPGAPEVVRHEEELVVERRERPYGRARLLKRVEEEPFEAMLPVGRDEVEVEEHEVHDPAADSGEVEHLDDGGVSVPVFEERLVVQRRPVVVRRVVVRRRRVTARQERVATTLRRERVEVEVDRHPDDVAAERDALAGEDLSRGPTPRTRHPDGGRDAGRDTTQGPTPEVRRAVRASGADAAAGEPGADRATRRPDGGGQDAQDIAAVRRVGIDPGPSPSRVDDPGA